MSKRANRLAAGLILLTATVGFGKKPENPQPVAAFKQRLSKDDSLHHALNRLTFGPRPGDLEAIGRVGLKRWIDEQVHPERISENPVLVARLQPLESLRLSIRDAYLRYPSPQIIGAIARGRGQLPDDPELRALVSHLVERYLQRKQLDPPATFKPARMVGAPPGTINLNTPPETEATLAENNKADQNPNGLSDFQSRVQLSDILTEDQIQTLRRGKPEEKRQLLESLPSDKRMDFVWALRPPQRQQLFAFAPVPLRRELMRSVSPQNVVATDLTEGKLLRAVYSTHQLQELMVDFWYNHFNVFLNKGADRYLVPTYEREAIRPHVFGKFHDLLLETAKSPAMLFYLDNWQSVAPDRAKANPRFNAARPKRGLNENYGRELLELHTLGVDGGYTQQDVVEVARCFTGWGIANPRRGGVFEYNDKVHDKERKVVLGHVIPAGGGMSDGLTVIDILSRHPSTAHFICYQLASRFVADNPPLSLVARMAKTFSKTKGDLREVVRTMLTASEFWSRGAYNAKIKTPFEMIVSALRATNADLTSGFALANELQKLGEPLYRKVEPTGYGWANSEWVSSAGLLDRMNFSLALAHNRISGIKIDLYTWATDVSENPLEVPRSILQKDPSDQTRLAIDKMISDSSLQAQLASNAKAGPAQVPSLIAGLTLGSPEFQRH